MNKQLMNRVLEQIREDIEKYNDFTAIEELLQHCPEDKLVGYLSDVMEDDWKYSGYSSQMSLDQYVRENTPKQLTPQQYREAENDWSYGGYSSQMNLETYIQKYYEP